MSDVDLAVRFFLQVVVILATSRALGWIGRKFLGQTQVVMEMAAGVALGPSLFGLIAPSAQAWLFPLKVAETGQSHPSMGVLYVIAQLGLVLYMFLVGLELDARKLRSKAKGAASVSFAGIALPFVLGIGVSVLMHDDKGFFSPAVTPLQGALYLGAAMCITAFPMLARIISERGLSGTSMGTLALAAGAIDDGIAWCVLAVVLASFKSEPLIALYALGGGTLYVAGMLTIGKRALKVFESWTIAAGGVSPAIASGAFLVLLCCAWFTDAIGIYAVFGAFVCGACMPRGEFSKGIAENLQNVTTGLLLPMFFVYSGLSTQVQLLATPHALAYTGLIVAVAVVGKWGGCALAARLSGESWRESHLIGVLMNARGLMGLIILNIGLQQGIVTPTLFTVMVLMALITTLMASPLFTWISGRSPVSDG